MSFFVVVTFVHVDTKIYILATNKASAVSAETHFKLYIYSKRYHGTF